MLQVTLAAVLHLGVDADHDGVVHAGGDHGFARRGQVGHAGGQVHALAVDVVVVDVELGGVEPGPQVQLLRRRQVLVGRVEVAVQRQRGAHGLGRVLEFGEQAIAQALDQAPAVRGEDLGGGVVHEAAPQAHHLLFVVRHQAHGLDEIDHEHGLVLHRRQLHGLANGRHSRLGREGRGRGDHAGKCDQTIQFRTIDIAR